MRLWPLSVPRCRATFVLAMVLGVLPSIATAGPVLLSFDVRLTSTGFLPIVDEFDPGVVVDGGVEINEANSTNVGDLFFDDEFVDVTSTAATTSLAYMIQGGGGAHPVAAGYQTSWPPVTTLLFSNFVLDEPGTLASVGVTVDQAGGVARVVGALGGPLVSGVDYVFTTDSLLLNISPLGILDQAGQTPLGLMTFRLDFLADEPPDPVSDPGSLTVIGMAMAAIAAHRRLARRRR